MGPHCMCSSRKDRTAFSWAKKLRIFDACICTRLTYGLFSEALTAKEKQRIDGFQARSLRRILRIPASYYSRIPNATVLKIAAETTLSSKIEKLQTKYLQKLWARPNDDPVKRCIFEVDGATVRKTAGTRKRGRPRTAWLPGVWQKLQREGWSVQELKVESTRSEKYLQRLFWNFSQFQRRFM